MNIKGKLMNLNTPIIMGILNSTPDSFSDGGSYLDNLLARKRIEQMALKGATIIDIGAQSTKPGATLIDAQEEIKRIGSLIRDCKKEFPNLLISLDTFYADVVDFGIGQGIDIVNDISAGNYDPALLPLVAKEKIPYVLMHTNPNYAQMHQKEKKKDVTLCLRSYFSHKCDELTKLGINDIILDPGFGFGKTIEDQYQICDEMQYLCMPDKPLLAGISRKSFLYKPLGKTPLDIDDVTQKMHRQLLEKGAKILRVHDVESTKRTIDLFLEKHDSSIF